MFDCCLDFSVHYKQKIKQKLQKNVITYLSAIVNLNANHKLDDMTSLTKYLTTNLDTEIFQVAIHRDEGHIDSKGNQIINHHAHIEMLGIDSNGKSIRRKLTRKFLIELQSQTAKCLKMQRGKPNKKKSKEEQKNTRRLDTYEFKHHKEREAKSIKKVVENFYKEYKKIENHYAKIKENDKNLIDNLTQDITKQETILQEKDTQLSKYQEEIARLKSELKENSLHKEKINKSPKIPSLLNDENSSDTSYTSKLF